MQICGFTHFELSPLKDSLSFLLIFQLWVCLLTPQANKLLLLCWLCTERRMASNRELKTQNITAPTVFFFFLYFIEDNINYAHIIQSSKKCVVLSLKWYCSIKINCGAPLEILIQKISKILLDWLTDLKPKWLVQKSNNVWITGI